MIERVPAFRLPLMDHFVEQGVAGRVPAVPANVAPRNDDFGWVGAARRTQFAQTTSHPIGNPNRNCRERSIEVLRIEQFVQLTQPIDEWLILRRNRSRLARTLRSRRNVLINRKLHENTTCFHPIGAWNTTRKKADDGLEHFVGCGGVSCMQPQAAGGAPADHDRAIAGKGDRSAWVEAESVEAIGEMERAIH